MWFIQTTHSFIYSLNIIHLNTLQSEYHRPFYGSESPLTTLYRAWDIHVF